MTPLYVPEHFPLSEVRSIGGLPAAGDDLRTLAASVDSGAQ